MLLYRFCPTKAETGPSIFLAELKSMHKNYWPKLTVAAFTLVSTPMNLFQLDLIKRV